MDAVEQHVTNMASTLNPEEVALLLCPDRKSPDGKTLLKNNVGRAVIVSVLDRPNGRAEIVDSVATAYRYFLAGREHTPELFREWLDSQHVLGTTP